MSHSDPILDEQSSRDEDAAVFVASASTGPRSGIRPSATPPQGRDTLVDPACVPPSPSLAGRLVHVLRLLPRLIGRAFSRAGDAVANHGKPPTLTALLPPPPRNVGKGVMGLSQDQFGELLLQNIFRLSPKYAAAVQHVAKLAKTVQNFPPEEGLAIYVHFVVSRIDTAGQHYIPIAWIRARTPDILRSNLDQALLRLESDGFLELLNPNTEEEVLIVAGIADHQRGRLTHVELIHPL